MAISLASAGFVETLASASPKHSVVTPVYTAYEVPRHFDVPYWTVWTARLTTGHIRRLAGGEERNLTVRAVRALKPVRSAMNYVVVIVGPFAEDSQVVHPSAQPAEITALLALEVHDLDRSKLADANRTNAIPRDQYQIAQLSGRLVE